MQQNPDLRDFKKHGDIILAGQPCLAASRFAARLGMQKTHVINTISKLVLERPSTASQFHNLTSRPVDCVMTRDGMEMLLDRFTSKKEERSRWKRTWLFQFDSAPQSAEPSTSEPVEPRPVSDLPFPVVAERTVGENQIQTVDARGLHLYLQNGDMFANWIKDRIRQYGFVEGVDFAVFLENYKKGRPSGEYAITIDMAKELAMVERNEQGRKARAYFIQCEKDLQKSRLQAPAEFDIRNPLLAAKALVQALEYSKELEGKLTTVEAVSASQAAAIETYKPIVAVHEEFVRAEGSLNLRTAAKALGLTQTEFMKRIRARYLITENGMEVPRAEFTTAGNGKGYFHVKWSMGNGKLRPQIYVTARGLTYFGIKLVKANGRVAQMQLPYIQGATSHAA